MDRPELKLVTAVHVKALRLVDAQNVWWHPRLHHTKNLTVGGFVQRLGDRTDSFRDLPQLVALWELARAGLIEASPVPIDPQAVRRPRPVVLTATGRETLRTFE